MTLNQTVLETDALHTPELEVLFGDPHGDGPFDYAAIVTDDDARRLNGNAEEVLDTWGAAAEFVPAALGGRCTDTAAMVERLRPILRRDPAVGLGYGLTTLMAAVSAAASSTARVLRTLRMSARATRKPRGTYAAMLISTSSSVM